jgi:arylsulfatase A-like enzyme
MTKRLNFVILHADQHRHDALGCAGNEFVSTPNLDQLARDGARFSHMFTTWPLCTTSRASSWTGVYPHSNGIVHNSQGETDTLKARGCTYRTVFEILHEGGWHTGYIGKWHLGSQAPSYFDYWQGFNSLGGHWVDGYQASQDGQWLPNVQTEQALEFLNDNASTEKPFCMTIAWYPPHDPYTAPADFMEKYRGKGIPVAGYYACCEAIDHNVGRILDAIDCLGLQDNTVVIYVSDHGETFSSRDGIPNKYVCHDDSVRIPLLIRHPSSTPPGWVSDKPVGVQDLLPTILTYAGLPIPERTQGRALQELLEEKGETWRDAYYIENEMTPHCRWLDASHVIVLPAIKQRALRTAQWKLILSEHGLHALYNLENDPEEVLDLYGAPYKDFYDQYQHFGPMDDVIYELAAKLKNEARTLNDEFGVTLAQQVLDNPISRVDLASLPDAIVKEFR